jgi:hypothetical protein
MHNLGRRTTDCASKEREEGFSLAILGVARFRKVANKLLQESDSRPEPGLSLEGHCCANAKNGSVAMGVGCTRINNVLKIGL